MAFPGFLGHPRKPAVGHASLHKPRPAGLRNRSPHETFPSVVVKADPMSGEDQQGWPKFAVPAAETKSIRHACRYISSTVLVGVLCAAPAAAGISPAAYREVGVFASKDARLPLDAVVTDEGGRRRTLAGLVSRASVLVFADFTCTTLCGPIVEFAA